MEISYCFINEIYKAKLSAKRTKKQQTPCFGMGFSQFTPISS